MQQKTDISKEKPKRGCWVASRKSLVAVSNKKWGPRVAQLLMQTVFWFRLKQDLV